MAIEYITPKDDDHWHEMRSQNINSTESSALFGLSPYQTEFDLWHRKRAVVNESIPDNGRMRAGRYLEQGIARMAANEIGCDCEPLKTYCRDTDSRIGASFDAVIISGDRKGYLIEVKNVDASMRYKWLDGDDNVYPPSHIEVQVQHQLELTDRPGAYVAVLFGGNDLRVIPIERNRKMGLGIRKRIERFWGDVDAENEPTPDYRYDADAIISRHQRAGEGVLMIDKDTTNGDEITSLLTSMSNLKAQEKAISQESKEVKARIMDTIGDEYSKVISGDITLSCGMVKGSEPTTITAEMIGKTYGGRKGYRNFKIHDKPEKNKARARDGRA